MTDLKKAAKMALDALEKGTTGLAIRAIPALRQALAQPEQEPVCDKDPNLCGFTLCQLAKVCKHTPKNTMPTKIFGPNLEQILNAAGFYRREWVGLTDDEIHGIIDVCTPDEAAQDELNDFAKAIFAAQAKLKEKNNAV